MAIDSPKQRFAVPKLPIQLFGDGLSPPAHRCLSLFVLLSRQALRQVGGVLLASDRRPTTTNTFTVFFALLLLHKLVILFSLLAGS